jgi:hypothetical protein
MRPLLPPVSAGWRAGQIGMTWAVHTPLLVPFSRCSVPVCGDGVTTIATPTTVGTTVPDTSCPSRDDRSRSRCSPTGVTRSTSRAPPRRRGSRPPSKHASHHANRHAGPLGNPRARSNANRWRAPPNANRHVPPDGYRRPATTPSPKKSLPGSETPSSGRPSRRRRLRRPGPRNNRPPPPEPSNNHPQFPEPSNHRPPLPDPRKRRIRPLSPSAAGGTASPIG